MKICPHTAQWTSLGGARSDRCERPRPVAGSARCSIAADPGRSTGTGARTTRTARRTRSRRHSTARTRCARAGCCPTAGSGPSSGPRSWYKGAAAARLTSRSDRRMRHSGWALSVRQCSVRRAKIASRSPGGTLPSPKSVHLTVAWTVKCTDFGVRFGGVGRGAWAGRIVRVGRTAHRAQHRVGRGRISGHGCWREGTTGVQTNPTRRGGPDKTGVYGPLLAPYDPGRGLRGAPPFSARGSSAARRRPRSGGERRRGGPPR